MPAPFAAPIPIPLRSASTLLTNQSSLALTRQKWCDFFADDSGRVTAWTFVPEAILPQILSGEIQECTVDHSEEDPLFRMAYQWMMDCMDESGIAGRKPGQSPWWCWIRTDKDYTKPSNRHGGEGQVLLELSIPANELLMSDFGMWHVPLNYWINAEGEEEEAFEQEIKAAGYSIWADKPLPEPFHSRVQEKWKDVFELEKVNGFTDEFESKSIQGVYWNLRPDIIKGVVEPAVFVDDDDHQEEE